MEDIKLDLQTINKIRHYFAEDSMRPLEEKDVSTINLLLNQIFDTEEKRQKLNENIERILTYETLSSIFRI